VDDLVAVVLELLDRVAYASDVTVLERREGESAPLCATTACCSRKS
jgi:hypothetical protein